MVDVQLFQLFQVLQVIDLCYLVLIGFQNLELAQLAELQTVEVFETVLAQVDDVEVLAAIQPFLDARVSVVVKALNTVCLQDENFQGREVAQHFDTGELVSTENKFTEMWEHSVVKHLLEIFESTVAKIKFRDVLSPATIKFFAKDLLSETTREMLSCLLLLKAFYGVSVQHFQFFEDVESVDSIAAVP